MEIIVESNYINSWVVTRDSCANVLIGLLYFMLAFNRKNQIYHRSNK